MAVLNKIKHKKVSDIIFDIFLYGTCLLVFLIVAYPLYFVIIASVSDSTLVSTGKVLFLPKGLSLFGYKEIFKDSRIWSGYMNTLIYAFGGTTVSLLVTLPAAYVLSRRDFPA